MHNNKLFNSLEVVADEGILGVVNAFLLTGGADVARFTDALPKFIYNLINNQINLKVFNAFHLIVIENSGQIKYLKET
jgi:hypothetical protein